MTEHTFQLAGFYVQLGAPVHSPELVYGARTDVERKPLKPGEIRFQVAWVGRPAVEVVTESPETH